MALSKTEVFEAIKAAKEAPYTPAARVSGCGRAYVCVGGTRAEVKVIEEACKAVGLMFLKKAYGVAGPAIYVGYDNADGRALARSEAMAKVLNEKGIKAYSDAVAD